MEAKDTKDGEGDVEGVGETDSVSEAFLKAVLGVYIKITAMAKSVLGRVQ
jgi:hypothetical protein